MTEIDAVVIGGGVVGLAAAWELARSHPRKTVAVLEKNRAVGLETSSRNSGVIHAGIYYPAFSLKARLCVRGNRLLYQFCEGYKVPYRRIGKMIVACEEAEFSSLEELYQKGVANGCELSFLGPEEIAEREPEVKAKRAIWSANTGIIDAYRLVKTLETLLIQAGGILGLGQEVVGLERRHGFYHLITPQEEIKCPVVINAAGLNSDRIAAMVGINVEACGYALCYLKGEYYALSPRLKLGSLVYPLPEEKALGIHTTIDLGGGQRLGPNAYEVETLDYSLDESRKGEFVAAGCRYLKRLVPEDLRPDFAGIRPRLRKVGHNGFNDFIINEETAKGLPGLVNLVGIDSPGLTSCLAIAQEVHELVRHYLV